MIFVATILRIAVGSRPWRGSLACLCFLSIIYCSGAVAEETPEQLVSETVLLENIAYTAKNYGNNSLEHFEAIATLINVYATQPGKNGELKVVLADFIPRLRAKYGENNRLLDEPLAMLAKQLIDEKEYAKAIPYLEELRKSLEWESYRQIPNGSEPPLLIPTEHGLAMALVRTARYEEAEIVFRSLIDRIEQKNAAEDLPILASALEIVGLNCIGCARITRLPVKRHFAAYPSRDNFPISRLKPCLIG